MDKKKSLSNTSVIIFLIFLVGAFILYISKSDKKEQRAYEEARWGGSLSTTSKREKDWTLMLFDSDPPAYPFDLKQRIDGYSSKTKCLEKGYELVDKTGSYLCGFKCDQGDSYGVVCKEVCNKKGCRE